MTEPVSEAAELLVERLRVHSSPRSGPSLSRSSTHLAEAQSDMKLAADALTAFAAREDELRRELNEARAELGAAREVCSLARRQDYFDVPTHVLVEAQIEAERWRVLTDLSEAVSERRPQIDAVLKRHRALLQREKQP